MSNTRHIQKRLTSEQIRDRLATLVEQMLPEYARETRTLTAEDCQTLSRELLSLRDELDRISRKGGCIVVCDERTEITTYRVNSYKPNARPTDLPRRLRQVST